jgi:predicted DCC family thiol-disulfide oxidoreductase YuxK
MLPDGKRLVLFDGVCNLCDAAVLFVIDRDPNEQFVFAPLSSPLGQRILDQHGLNRTSFDSIVLVDQGRVFSHSDAIVRIGARLGGPYRLFWLLLLLPAFLRNWGYRWFARHRYDWFGKSDQCRVPTPELRRRFVANG